MDHNQLRSAISDLLKEGAVAGNTLDLVPDHVEEWADPPASDPDGFVDDQATVNGANPIVLNGDLAGTVLSPPRNIICTLNDHADHDAGNAVITGTDINDAVMTETLVIPNGGNTVVVGVKCFKTVTSITHPTTSGTNGTINYGTGNAIGLGRKLKLRQSGACVLYEINANALVAAVQSAYAGPATAAPNGSYTPATTTPNGTRGYALRYEVDRS